KVRLPYNLPSFSIAAALIALQNRTLLLESIPETLSERAKLIEILSQQPELQITPSAANFIYLRLKPNGFNSQDAVLKTFHQKLRTLGTLVRHISG
ncbi:MAG: histidinol-phosphate transaminase, partial [Nostoc sp.]